MSKCPSPIVIMVFGLLCVVAGVLLTYGCEKYDSAFHHSSFDGPGPAISDAPVRFYQELMVWEVK